MSSSRLLTYDPLWQSKWDAQYARLPVLWNQLMAEKHERGRISPDTKAAYIDAIQGMRKARKRQFQTPADVARRTFNIIAARAFMAGVKKNETPDPESFATLRDVRLYFMDEIRRIRETQRKRRPSSAFSLPVLPRGEGRFFRGDEGEMLGQAVRIPDIDGGITLAIITEATQSGTRHVCIIAHDNPSRVRGFLPQIATALSQRMFGADDPRDLEFFVHHPINFGPRGHEQYWHYDVRADLRGTFHMAGRNMMHTLPHAVAYPQFIDEKPIHETQALVLGPQVNLAAAQVDFDAFVEAQAANTPKPKPH